MPHADGSLHPLPAGGFDGGAACMFSDVYPTSYECACLHAVDLARGAHASRSVSSLHGLLASRGTGVLWFALLLQHGCSIM